MTSPGRTGSPRTRSSTEGGRSACSPSPRSPRFRAPSGIATRTRHNCARRRANLPAQLAVASRSAQGGDRREGPLLVRDGVEAALLNVPDEFGAGRSDVTTVRRQDVLGSCGVPVAGIFVRRRARQRAGRLSERRFAGGHRSRSYAVGVHADSREFEAAPAVPGLLLAAQLSFVRALPRLSDRSSWVEMRRATVWSPSS